MGVTVWLCGNIRELTWRSRTAVRSPVGVKGDFLALLCVNLTPLVDAVMAEALAVWRVVAQFGALQSDAKMSLRRKANPCLLKWPSSWHRSDKWTLSIVQVENGMVIG